MSLGPAEFGAFFQALYDRPAFPWQTRLVTKICESGVWPDVLDLPTGTGKTAAIDIAIFHLACEAHKGKERRAPIRILFVIDRRIVVDAAHERARTIAKRLAEPGDSTVLKKVAEALATLSGDKRSPLRAVRLRGGTPLEPGWARLASQPLVCVSTVDQVGSRLLFRGYGVSRKMWPVHAGLVGSDALWLLDEAHLAQPLVQTLRALRSGDPNVKPRLAPFGVVHLSATAGENSGQIFTIDDRDRENEVLKRRLSAPKKTRLEIVEKPEEFVSLCRQRACEAAGFGDKNASTEMNPANGRAVGVIVNRVDTARKIFEELRGTLRDRAGVSLLIGRCRPIDRDAQLSALLPHVEAGRDRSSFLGQPQILVATQTIEVGADLDFDALVTEIAPLDSLRQRFGRLDRLGDTGNAQAWIVAREAAVAKNADDDPVYEDRLPKVWAWLVSQATKGKVSRKRGKEHVLDLGIAAMQKRLKESESQLADLVAARTDAPLLFPAYTALWSSTSPPPTATPEPSLFLHGPDRPADVGIVWRADLEPANMAESVAALEACPPSVLETMPIPVWAAKAWLSGLNEQPIADAPMKYAEGRDEPSQVVGLRQNDSDQWEVVTANRIRPGDLIVVPATLGGCDEWGWNPRLKAEVSDLGDLAHEMQRGKISVRLTSRALANALTRETRTDAARIWSAVAGVLQDLGSGESARAIAIALSEINGLPEDWTRRLKEAIKNPRALDYCWYDEERPARGIVIFTKWRVRKAEEADNPEPTSERDDSSHTGREVLLETHCREVAREAREDAQRVGMPVSVARVLGLAGLLHDFGKADPRFQAELYGSPRAYRQGSPLLAKSERPYVYRHSRSGFAPEGFRHEALSVALALGHPEVAGLSDDDRDLLLWLVGTHHGYGRVFFPACVDTQPDTRTRVAFDGVVTEARAKDAPVRLDQGWFELADRVRRRWSPWELARLEAIVRLADHRVSANEQNSGERQ